MNRKKTIYATFYLIFLMAFTGCATKLYIKPLENNESRLSLSLELGKILEETLDSAMAGLTEMDGTQTQNVIFDIPSIKKSLSDAGYKDIEVSSSSRTSLDLSFSGKFDFIECTESKTSLKITPAIMQNFSNSMGEEFKSVMDLFMAPVLSDESMTVEEYGELVAVVYGQKMADEMLKSKMEINISSPTGKIKACKIPLADLLTLNKEMVLISD